MIDGQGTLLIVDDERSIRHSLRTILSTLGFGIIEAARGEEAIVLVRTAQIDAVVLDIDMPGIGGVATCRGIRRAVPTMPIVMLSVHNTENQIADAFNAGADDYVTKPFQLREFTARIHASMRWNKLRDKASSEIVIGDVSLDPSRHEVKKRGSRVHLTPRQFEILQCLMEQGGGAVPHRRLLRKIRGPEYGNELEYLRTYIRQLRVKIEDDPANPKYLLTDSHYGYRFAEPE